MKVLKKIGKVLLIIVLVISALLVVGLNYKTVLAMHKNKTVVESAVAVSEIDIPDSVQIVGLGEAIVLVTIGTYALFISGTIFVLKMLKKNKKYYYQTRHFISLSNLIFRMKHNAAGLASICILSTAVILLMVCSGALMMLGEQNINSMFRRDIVTWCQNDGSLSIEGINKIIDETLLEGNVEGTEKIVRLYHEDLCCGDEKGLTPLIKMTADYSQMRVMYLITADQYNEYTGENISLGEDEIFRYSSADKVKEGSF